MTTLHLGIVCITTLALAALATRAVREGRPTMHELGGVFAGQVAVAIAAKQNDLGRALQAELAAIAANTASPAGQTPAPSRLGETVAIRTRLPDETTVRGIVAAEHTDRIVLREAVVYDRGTEGGVAGGLVEIFRLNVSTVQVIPARAEPV